MSLVQKMNGNNKTFGQVAESLFTQVLHEGAQSERIDVVFDVYRHTSIKDAERLNRGADTTVQYKNLVGGITYSSGELFCAALPTRPVLSSFWWKSGNSHNTERGCMIRCCT